MMNTNDTPKTLLEAVKFFDVAGAGMFSNLCVYALAMRGKRRLPPGRGWRRDVFQSLRLCSCYVGEKQSSTRTEPVARTAAFAVRVSSDRNI